MTPYDIAIIKNSKEVAKYLKSLGGEAGSEIAEKKTDSIKKISKIFFINNNKTSSGRMKLKAMLRN